MKFARFENFSTVMPKLLNLNVKAACSSETSETTRLTTQHYALEVVNVHDILSHIAAGSGRTERFTVFRTVNKN